MKAQLAQLQGAMATELGTQARPEIAKIEFSQLPPSLQAKLLTIASRSNMVLRRLAAGDWQSLQRALAGLNIRYPDQGYMATMAELDRLTVHELAR